MRTFSEAVPSPAPRRRRCAHATLLDTVPSRRAGDGLAGIGFHDNCPVWRSVARGRAERAGQHRADPATATRPHRDSASTEGWIAGLQLAALVVPGDAAATAHHILAHELLYRMGHVVHIINTLCNIPLALIVYDLSKVVFSSTFIPEQWTCRWRSGPCVT